MNYRISLLIVAGLCVSSLIGCRSISSTAISRMDSDELIGDSNGERTKHCAARPFRGIPITLRVPTHVDIAIKEKVRLSFDGESLAKVNTPKRHLLIEPTPIYTAKVFTVDVKRPAAGTADYTLEFGGRTVDMDNSQYFKSIKSRIVDETISDITTALKTITTGFSASTGEDDDNDSEDDDDDESTETPATTAEPLYLDQVRTVAWKRFDVDALDFEQQLGEFVEQHMNGCSTCLDYRSPTPEAYPLVRSNGQPPNNAGLIELPVIQTPVPQGTLGDEEVLDADEFEN